MSLRPSAKTDGEYSLLIYGDIGPSWWGEGVEAKDVAKQLRDLAPNTALTVRINSFGGSVADGLAIYNALREHKGKKTVIIDGIAASAASLIAMAGDDIEMPETSMMMIHAPWSYASGNAAELRRSADVLDKWSASMVAAYARKSGKSEDDIKALLAGEDHWYTGSEAVAEGFADRIRDPDLSEPANASLTRAPVGVRHMALAAYRGALPQPTQEDTMTVQTDPQVETETEQPQAAVDPEAAIQARVEAAVAAAQAEAQAKVAAAEAEAAQARAAHQAEVEAREEREVVAEVTKTFANIPGDHAVLGKAVRALRKADPEASAKLEAALASANALLENGKAAGLEPLGSSTADQDETPPEAKVEKLAKAAMEQDSKLTIEQAKSLVYTQHPELVKAVRGEKD